MYFNAKRLLGTSVKNDGPKWAGAQAGKCAWTQVGA